MKTLQYGTRPDIRDRLLEILSDGKHRHISDIKKELNWPKTTSVSKTLADIKAHLVMTRDPRRLNRIKFDNLRKGTIWYLTYKN